jgi:hypothetical protein
MLGELVHVQKGLCDGAVVFLDAPLSQLANHVRPKGMAMWVYRSTQTRLAEVADRGHKVTRPPNSFMLYRSDYAERIKFVLPHPNPTQQAVSRLAAICWEDELPAVKTFYKELAAIEKHNHGEALSSYGPGARRGAKAPKKTKRSRSSASPRLRHDSTCNPSSHASIPPSNPDVGSPETAQFACTPDPFPKGTCDADAKPGFMELDAELLSASSFGEPISSFILNGDYFEAQTSALDEQVGPGEEWLEHWSEYSR